MCSRIGVDHSQTGLVGPGGRKEERRFLKGYGIENADISESESFGEKSILFERDFVVHQSQRERHRLLFKIICLADYAA